MSTKDDISDDLAYVKALAEEGRDTPLVGGIMYVIWGCLIGAAALRRLRPCDELDQPWTNGGIRAMDYRQRNRLGVINISGPSCEP